MGNQVSGKDHTKKSRLINYDDAGLYVAIWIGKRPDWYTPTTVGSRCVLQGVISRAHIDD